MPAPEVPSAPMNLLQVRRILHDFLHEPQDDPDDISSFMEHAIQCVVSRPQEFDQPELLLSRLRQAYAISGAWDWQARPPLPQLAGDETWWEHPAWERFKDLLRQAEQLLPAIGEAERAELERQGADNPSAT